ncbi:MAG: cell division protein SepF [Thermoplasmataceae archaeon]
MALLRGNKSKSKPSRGKDRSRKFIDLDELKMQDDFTGSDMVVRIVEINRYDDVSRLSEFTYGGTILIIDYSPVADDELIRRKVLDDIKYLGRDTGGDVAGFGKNMIILTPKGVSVDRNVVRGII